MKAIVVPALILFSIPALAAKLKDAKCSDVAVTPEYLAVIDGYDSAGKKVSEEVDMGTLVAESKMVNENCAKDKTANIDTVRKDIKSSNVGPQTASTLNPIKAKCSDFVALGEEIQPIAAFWVAGHDKSGKLKNGEVDEEFLARPVATLVEDCKAQPRASFYDKAKAWFRKRV